MTDNVQRADTTEVTVQRAEWIKPEVVRMNASDAELDFNGPDDGLGQTS
jgi:hypothetical protein